MAARTITPSGLHIGPNLGKTYSVCLQSVSLCAVRPSTHAVVLAAELSVFCSLCQLSRPCICVCCQLDTSAWCSGWYSVDDGDALQHRAWIITKLCCPAIGSRCFVYVHHMPRTKNMWWWGVVDQHFFFKFIQKEISIIEFRVTLLYIKVSCVS